MSVDMVFSFTDLDSLLEEVYADVDLPEGVEIDRRGDILVISVDGQKFQIDTEEL